MRNLHSHTLLYTIKASVHTCFVFNSLTLFNSLTRVQILSLISISLVQFIVWLNLSNKLSKVKIALCSKLYKNEQYNQHQPSSSVLELSEAKVKVS